MEEGDIRPNFADFPPMISINTYIKEIVMPKQVKKVKEHISHDKDKTSCTPVKQPSKHLKAGHHRPASETPF